MRPNYNNNKLRPAQFPLQLNKCLGNRKPFLVKCQWCNNKGHVLSQCRTFRQKHPAILSPPRDSPHVNTATASLPFLPHSGLPLTYWPQTVTTAAYLINRLPTPILGYHSPYLKLHKISLNYRKLKCFGCLCFPRIKPYVNHKLSPKSSICVFVGYSTDKHAYLCLNPTMGKFIPLSM